MPLPMDNGRMEYLCGRAMAGGITQQERDEMLVGIYRSLWSSDRFAKSVEAVHERLCAARRNGTICGTRRPPSLPAGIAAMLAGNRLPWIVVGILALIIAALLGVNIGPILRAGR